MNLSKSPLLGDVDLLAARELDLGPAEGLSHMLLVLQAGVDGHYDLAGVDPGHFTLGLSKGSTHTCLEPRLGPDASCDCPLERAVPKFPVQITGGIHDREGRSLQPLHTSPPWGTEHRRFN